MLPPAVSIEVPKGEKQCVYQPQDWRIWLLSGSAAKEDESYKVLDAALREQCALASLSYEVVLLHDLIMSVERGQLKLYMNGSPITTYPHVVYFRGLSPDFKMDDEVTVLRHLEKMGCRVVNRVQCMPKCINKFWTLQELAGHGIPVPDSISYGGYWGMGELIELGEPLLSYPLVVKKTRVGQGNAVFLAKKMQISDIQHLLKSDTPYLFQKYIQESHGHDVRVMVIGGKVVASVINIARGGQSQSNYARGSASEAYTLDETDRNLVTRVSEILGMDICMLDLLMREDGSLCVCEVNINPDFIMLDEICHVDITSRVAQHVISLLPNPSVDNN